MNFFTKISWSERMLGVVRILLPIVIWWQSSSGLHAKQAEYEEPTINRCLNFTFQQSVSGSVDSWDQIGIDYEVAIPSELMEELAVATQNQDCLISPNHSSFDRSNGLMWALALHGAPSGTNQILTQLEFQTLKEGEVFLLGYLVAMDRFEGTPIRDAATIRLKQLAEFDVNAIIKMIDVIPSLPSAEYDALIQRGIDLGSTTAFIRQASEEEVQAKLSDKSFLDKISQEDRSRLIYYSCSQTIAFEQSDDTESRNIAALCKDFEADPQMLLYRIFGTLNKPYGKNEIIFAKDELFKFLEDPSLLVGNWPEEFTLNEQAAILLFQLFAHFGEDRTVFSEKDVERYIDLAVTQRVPINRIALGYYLSGLYSTYHIYDLDAPTRETLETIFAILSSGEDSAFDQCTSEKKLQFSAIYRWPVGPQLPIISSIDLFDIEFLELESAAADQGKIRIFGQWKHFDPSFLNLQKAETDKLCQFNFVDFGKLTFPTNLQKVQPGFPLQREFTAEIYNPEATGIVTLTESEFVGTPRGEMIWGFDANQSIKLNTDLRSFPFSTKRTAIEFGLVSKSQYISFPALMSGIEVIDAGVLLNEDDGNRFFAGEKDTSKADIRIEASLYINLTYYTLRIIAPVLIFVSLGLFTLLKARENTEAQLQVATTVMVALVAYQFVINATLPQLPYLTLIDMFLLASVASSAFIILFNLVPHLEKNDTWISTRLFQASRIGGVGGYMVSAMILVYGFWLYSQS